MALLSLRNERAYSQVWFLWYTSNLVVICNIYRGTHLGVLYSCQHTFIFLGPTTSVDKKTLLRGRRENQRIVEIILVIGSRYKHNLYFVFYCFYKQWNPSQLSQLVVPININDNHWILCVCFLYRVQKHWS